ncbi:uncharacterized protein YjbI with pentapeptide repeats [Oxalobacteraceae bacterium GrIS 2.11]
MQSTAITTALAARAFEDVRQGKNISASAYPWSTFFAKLWDFFTGQHTYVDAVAIGNTFDNEAKQIFERMLEIETSQDGFLNKNYDYNAIEFTVDGEKFLVVEENDRANGTSKLSIVEDLGRSASEMIYSNPKKTELKFKNFAELKTAFLKAFLAKAEHDEVFADLSRFDLSNMDLSKIDFRGAIIDKKALPLIINGGRKLPDVGPFADADLTNADVQNSLDLDNTRLDNVSNKLSGVHFVDDTDLTIAEVQAFLEHGGTDLNNVGAITSEDQLEQGMRYELQLEKASVGKELAHKLIAAGAEPTEVFQRYLDTERQFGNRKHIDIRGFDLTEINLKQVNLRGVNIELLENHSDQTPLSQMRRRIAEGPNGPENRYRFAHQLDDFHRSGKAHIANDLSAYLDADRGIIFLPKSKFANDGERLGALRDDKYNFLSLLICSEFGFPIQDFSEHNGWSEHIATEFADRIQCPQTLRGKLVSFLMNKMESDYSFSMAELVSTVGIPEIVPNDATEDQYTHSDLSHIFAHFRTVQQSPDVSGPTSPEPEIPVSTTANSHNKPPQPSLPRHTASQSSHSFTPAASVNFPPVEQTSSAQQISFSSQPLATEVRQAATLNSTQVPRSLHGSELIRVTLKNFDPRFGTDDGAGIAGADDIADAFTETLQPWLREEFLTAYKFQAPPGYQLEAYLRHQLLPANRPAQQSTVLTSPQATEVPATVSKGSEAVMSSSLQVPTVRASSPADFPKTGLQVDKPTAPKPESISPQELADALEEASLLGSTEKVLQSVRLAILAASEADLTSKDGINLHVMGKDNSANLYLWKSGNRLQIGTVESRKKWFPTSAEVGSILSGGRFTKLKKVMFKEHLESMRMLSAQTIDLSQFNLEGMALRDINLRGTSVSQKNLEHICAPVLANLSGVTIPEHVSAAGLNLGNVKIDFEAAKTLIERGANGQAVLMRYKYIELHNKVDADKLDISGFKPDFRLGKIDLNGLNLEDTNVLEFVKECIENQDWEMCARLQTAILPLPARSALYSAQHNWTQTVTDGRKTAEGAGTKQPTTSHSQDSFAEGQAFVTTLLTKFDPKYSNATDQQKEEIERDFLLSESLNIFDEAGQSSIKNNLRYKLPIPSDVVGRLKQQIKNPAPSSPVSASGQVKPNLTSMSVPAVPGSITSPPKVKNLRPDPKIEAEGWLQPDKNSAGQKTSMVPGFMPFLGLSSPATIQSPGKHSGTLKPSTSSGSQTQVSSSQPNVKSVGTGQPVASREQDVKRLNAIIIQIVRHFNPLYKGTRQEMPIVKNFCESLKQPYPPKGLGSEEVDVILRFFTKKEPVSDKDIEILEKWLKARTTTTSNKNGKSEASQQARIEQAVAKTIGIQKKQLKQLKQPGNDSGMFERFRAVLFGKPSFNITASQKKNFDYFNDLWRKQFKKNIYDPLTDQARKANITVFLDIIKCPKELRNNLTNFLLMPWKNSLNESPEKYVGAILPSLRGAREKYIGQEFVGPRLSGSNRPSILRGKESSPKSKPGTSSNGS